MKFAAHKITCCSGLALLVSVSSVLAQDGASPVSEAGTTESRSSTSFTVEGTGTYFGDSDVDGAAGDVSVVRAGGLLSFRHIASDQLVVFGNIGHAWSDYDFENASGLFPGASDAKSPFDSLHESVLSLGFSYGLDDSWFVFGRGLVGAGFENGADFGDSIYGGAFAGYGYRFSDQLSLSLGAGVITRLEDDPLVIPVLSAQWQINDEWRLETEGLGAKLAWSATDSLELHGFLRYSSRVFRMDDANPYLAGGSFTDRRALVGVGASWQPNDRATFSLEAGASVWQQFRFFDQNGNEIAERDTDPQLMLRAGIEFQF